MKEQEKLLRAAALMTILRDDLEELNVEKELKNKTNLWLKQVNKRMRVLADGGEESNEQLIALTQLFEQKLQFEVVD